MGLKEGIISYLLEYHRSYANLRKSLYGGGINNGGSSRNERSLYVVLARLKKEGLVKKENGIWRLTISGSKFSRKIKNKKRFPHSQVGGTKQKKNLVVIFDIPEAYRSRRDWLRCELISLGFEQIQKSVWLGPSPLPRSFLENTEEMGILKYTRFFRAEPQKIV